MANIRLKIKWVRDLNKRQYRKDTKCAICATTELLEFHHYFSLTLLFERWIKLNNLIIDTDEDVLKVREQFSEEHKRELLDEAVTLCKAHHAKLHKIYSITPALHTAPKQKRWVAIQAEKLGNKYEYEPIRKASESSD